jgi:tetratricopeptide (TPR) repeat protein
MKLDSKNAWNFGDYARIRLFERGDYETAITYFNKALSIKNYGRARYQLAIAYYVKWADINDDQSKLEEANESWQMAKTLYSDTNEILDSMMRYDALKSAGKELASKMDSKL